MVKSLIRTFQLKKDIKIDIRCNEVQNLLMSLMLQSFEFVQSVDGMNDVTVLKDGHVYMAINLWIG